MTRLALIVLSALAIAGCDTGTRPPDASYIDVGEVVDPTRDSDGDSITDIIEGWRTRDTDGDGQPDWEDTDSDADGITDAVEAGDDDRGTLPIDTDMDGAPDYVDEDSDGNGLEDRIEGVLDSDGDGALDYVDFDDDDDRIDDVLEIGDGAFPRDSDVDGMPDFRDDDSDGDTIADREESTIDTEGDGTLDVLDLDSDNDGFEDAIEAGDADLDTVPVDTDGDLIADYRDPDSDADGLSDALEHEAGSLPTSADSDGDTQSDLIEVGAGTDPLDRNDSPRMRGDFVFVVPFREEPMPPRDTLEFRTNIRRADVYFQFDTTGSMIGEISNMRDRVVEILDGLGCAASNTPCFGDLGCQDGEICSFEGVCITDPNGGCIPDLWTGVGVYSGYENSYRNLLSLQPDPLVTRDAIPAAADGPGGSESLFESVACVADPRACFGAVCSPGGIGCPAFRRDAVRILVTITDETNQCTNTDCRVVNTAGAAGGRLRLQRIQFVGIDADGYSHSPRADLRAVGVSAGSVNSDGEPFYYEGDGAAVSSAVVSAIRDISSELSLYVDISAEDVAGDDGDSLQFIQRLEVNTTTFGCSSVPSTTDVDGDGYADAFPSLATGTPVCWDVVVRPNARVRPIDRPQVFLARLTVAGDGSPLDQRRVFFLVPPTAPLVCPDPPCE
jgi:hypothetical protein